MYKGKKVSVIIAAAGSARRMRGIDKLFMRLGDRSVLAQVVRSFERDPFVDEIVISVRENQVGRCRDEMIEKYGYRKIAAVVPGGAERPESVKNALNAVAGDTDIILVQDGARPFTDAEMISRVLEAVCVSGAAVPAVPVKDTIKVIENGSGGEAFVTATPERSSLRAVQTPQGFQADLLRRAYGLSGDGEILPQDLSAATDDASLVERLGSRVLVVEGSEDNIKITTPEDVEKAELILGRREGSEGAEAFRDDLRRVPRTGIGFDVHAFAEGRRLILGGVDIPYEKGLAGHSDADVLVHAIMDALLGAAALRDIGYYFPDSDPAFKGADSRMLLARVVELLEEQSWSIVNIDAVMMAQAPKLAPYIETMKKNIAAVLKIPENCVGVKATTTERLGFTGRGEGIAAQAVAVLV